MFQTVFCIGISSKMGAPVYLCVLIFIWSKYLTVSECQGLYFKTPPRYSYQPLIPYGIHLKDRNWIPFQVKTKQDAHLSLQAYHNTTDIMYEVVLGASGNSHSVIRNSPQGTDRVKIWGGIVSENEYKKFWVSWNQGTVTVGRGSDRGSDVLMTWTDPNPQEINYLAVSTWDNVPGEWIFEKADCTEQRNFTILKKDAVYTPSDARMLTTKYVTSTHAGCARRCFSNTWCHGFSYESSGHECNLFDVAPQIQELVESAGWETWSLIQ